MRFTQVRVLTVESLDSATYRHPIGTLAQTGIKILYVVLSILRQHGNITQTRGELPDRQLEKIPVVNFCHTQQRRHDSGD